MTQKKKKRRVKIQKEKKERKGSWYHTRALMMTFIIP
jgi:hypothetical protein